MDKRTKGITNLHLLIMLACLWGLMEAGVGVYLRGTCARLFSGSLLMGGAFFFLASAYVTSGRLWPLLLLPGVAACFRIYAALLAGTPVLTMAVANPIYAFFTEALALILILVVVKETMKTSLKGCAAVGVLAATVGASLFPAVKYFTGIAACVLPGTSVPLALYGLPVAAAFSACTVPLGFVFGAWLLRRTEIVSMFSWKVSTAVSTLCFIAITILYV